MKNDNNNLDEINNKRVETTKLRVAHAINLLDNPIGCLIDGRKIDRAETDIAHAVNLLEAANQEMQWACKHFEWDDGVCMQIEDACGKLGSCLAMIISNDEDYDLAGYMGKDGMNVLGQVLATLIRWFDDDQDVSEV